MTTNLHTLLSPQKSLLALQGTVLVLLTIFLINTLSGGKALILLGVILAGIGGVLICAKPHWGVLIILSVWITQFDPIGIPYLGIPYLVSVLLFVPLVLSVLRYRDIFVFQSSQIKIFLVLGILFLISSLWSDFKYPVTLFPERDETAKALQHFFSRLIWLFFFVYFMRSRKKIELTIWLVVGLITAAVISAFLRDESLTMRAKATFSFGENANRFAFMSLFATSVLWFYRSHAIRPRWNLLTLPAVGFTFLMALAAGSRSGLLQLLVLVGLVVKEQRGWSAAKRLRTLFLLGCIAMLMLVVVPTAQLVRATSYEASASAPGGKSLQQRLTRILNAAEMIMSDPVFGIGIGNFPWVSRAFYPPGGDPHNSYLRALSEGGIGVFLSYLSLFYVTYRMLRKLERTGPTEFLWLSKALKANLILFLIFTAFADFWISPFLYIIVGLTIAMTHLEPSHVPSASWSRSRPHLAPFLVLGGVEREPKLSDK